MKQVKQLDFSGQTIFCGVDVHKKSWKVCLRLKEMELKIFSQNPSPIELATHLKKNYPGANYRVVYEAGFCGFNYQRELNKEGLDCILVHPADVPTMDKEKQRKSDTVDCRKLSKTLSEGTLTGIYIPSVEQQNDRAVIRTYLQMVKDQTRFKNRIKSWLDFQGVSIPANDEYKYWSNNFTEWLRQLPLKKEARISLDLLLEGYLSSRKMVLAATRELRLLSRQDRYQENIRLLRTVPGIGPITALLFITEIGNVDRFKDLDSLCDYIGLVPKTASSSDRERVFGLTHRGNRQLRENLIEASWIAIRKDPALVMSFTTYQKRMKKNRAIIKIARKMLNRIRFVMKHQKEYVALTVE